MVTPLTPDQRRLVEENMHLVYSIVSKQFLTMPFEIEDMQQDGMIGLMQAAAKFDPSRGYMFSSYATEAIRNRILQRLQVAEYPKRKPPSPVLSLDVRIPDLDGDVCYIDLISDPSVDVEREVELSILVEDLQPRQRQVVEMYADGYNYTEIGKAMGFSRTMPYLIINSVRRQLRPLCTQ